MTKRAVTIRTIKGGRDYYARMAGIPEEAVISYRFMLAQDGKSVIIATESGRLGAWALSRFGGKLSPAGIRKFVKECMK